MASTWLKLVGASKTPETAWPQPDEGGGEDILGGPFHSQMQVGKDQLW